MFKNLKLKDYLFLIPILFVLLVKTPHLSLPYFWDEAWSYITAINKMYETGPGLLPGALPLEISKGHPLFFFFIYSTWMRLFGTSITVVHSLSLLISVATLLATYWMVKKHANRNTALLSIVLLSVQSLFLAQATMVLPEMLVTFLLLLSIHLYLLRKFVWFALTATLMVLTKETSVIFLFGFLLVHLNEYFKSCKELKKFLFESSFISIPLVTYAAFLVLHKHKFGSFFYPVHTDFVEFGIESVQKKLEMATAIIFTRYGRNALLLVLIGSLALLIIKKKKPENTRLLILLLIQTLFYLLFTAINFYSPRYTLSLMVLFVVAAAVLMSVAHFSKNWMNAFIIAFVIALPLYSTFTKKSNNDKDLGYVEAIKVHQEMVHFCEKQQWQDKRISASFNLIYYLRDPSLGYIEGVKEFLNVSDLLDICNSEVYLLECTNIGKQAQVDSIRNKNRLVKRFELDKAWGEIYTNLDLH